MIDSNGKVLSSGVPGDENSEISSQLKYKIEYEKFDTYKRGKETTKPRNTTDNLILTKTYGSEKNVVIRLFL